MHLSVEEEEENSRPQRFPTAETTKKKANTRPKIVQGPHGHRDGTSTAAGTKLTLVPERDKGRLHLGRRDGKGYQLEAKLRVTAQSDLVCHTASDTRIKDGRRGQDPCASAPSVPSSSLRVEVVPNIVWESRGRMAGGGGGGQEQDRMKPAALVSAIIPFRRWTSLPVMLTHT